MPSPFRLNRFGKDTPRAQAMHAEARLRVGTLALMFVALGAFLGVGIWRVKEAYDRPLIATSISDEPFLVPKALVCGLCLNVGTATPQCARPQCTTAYHMSSDPGPAWYCDSWLQPVPRRLNYWSSEYWNVKMIDEADDFGGFDKHCVALVPPEGEAFDPERRSSISITLTFDEVVRQANATWEVDVNGSRLEEYNWHVPVGVVDQTAPLEHMSPFDTNLGVDSHSTFRYHISRVLHRNLAGEEHFRTDHPPPEIVISEAIWNNAGNTQSRGPHTPMAIQFLPDAAWNMRIETETPSYSWLEFLGNVAGVVSGLLFLYTVLMGGQRVSPWGVVQRAFVRKGVGEKGGEVGGTVRTATTVMGSEVGDRTVGDDSAVEAALSKYLNRALMPGDHTSGPSQIPPDYPTTSALTTPTSPLSTHHLPALLPPDPTKLNDDTPPSLTPTAAAKLIPLIPLIIARLSAVTERYESLRRREQLLEHVLHQYYCRYLDVAMGGSLEGGDA